MLSINDKDKIEKLYEILVNILSYEQEAADDFVLALLDIGESIVEIYDNIVPKILEGEIRDKEYYKDLLWDISSEIQHITYHIEDADLENL
jgi:hypothetical protein